MKIIAISKYVRISPSKSVPLARLLRGLPVAKALEIVQFSNTKAARVVDKTLKSAIANAENNAKVSLDDFRVKEVCIEQGPIIRRYWHRSKGMARPIKRRTSHIRVVLADEA